jgi:hypothetical protein
MVRLMFGKRSKRLNRRVRENSFMFLDAMERGRWEGRQEGIPWFEGREAARVTADNIRGLLDVCDGHRDKVVQAVEEWAQERQAELDAKGDEERSSHVGGVWGSSAISLSSSGCGGILWSGH